MDLSLKGLRFLARREALVLVAYIDGRHPSIGFGHNDKRLKIGVDKIDVKTAHWLLRQDIKTRIAEVGRKLKVPVSQQQFDALVSCYYQSGNKFINDVIALINNKQINEAAELLVDHPLAATDSTGLKIPTLRIRRKHEQRVFISGNYGVLSPIPVWYSNPFNEDGTPRAPDEWKKVTDADF